MKTTYPNDSIHNSEECKNDGLTKREYFAALAMQGFASSNPNISFSEQAKWAVTSADKLIEELNKKAEL
jgi:hypothetical protein